MNEMLNSIDPNSTVGTIVVGVCVTLLSAGIIAVFAWFLGPLKWLIHSRRLRKLLKSGRHFRFVFNPGANKSKLVTFLADGEIGEGRNSNEHTWRIRRGVLLIFAHDEAIYSRFVYNPKTGRIEHTNDPDTRSILGQYFEPQYRKWNQESRTSGRGDGGFVARRLPSAVWSTGIDKVTVASGDEHCPSGTAACGLTGNYEAT